MNEAGTKAAAEARVARRTAATRCAWVVGFEADGWGCEILVDLHEIGWVWVPRCPDAYARRRLRGWLYAGMRSVQQDSTR